MVSKFFCLLILLVSFNAVGNECYLNEALKDPVLANNAEFWQEYGKVAHQGPKSDIEIKKLIERYRDHDAKAAAAAPVEKTLQLRVQLRAEKELNHLPAPLKQKVDEFLQTAMKPGGMKELYNNPGRWHFEKMARPHEHTIRLNEGYRVLFSIEGDELKILRINKGQIHGN